MTLLFLGSLNNRVSLGGGVENREKLWNGPAGSTPQTSGVLLASTPLVCPFWASHKGHNFLHLVQQKFLLMHHFQIFFSLQKNTDAAPATYCTLKCQGSFRHRCAITVTPLTVTLLPDLDTSACFTKKSKKTAFDFDSLFPLTAVTEKIPILTPFLILPTQAVCMPSLDKQTMAYLCA